MLGAVVCMFEVPVPNEPFPRVNESKVFGDRIAVLARRAVRRLVLKRLLPILGIVAAVMARYYWVSEGRPFFFFFLG